MWDMRQTIYTAVNDALHPPAPRQKRHNKQGARLLSMLRSALRGRGMNFLSQFIARNQRLILTLISKQWVVFFLGTVLLVRGFVTAEVWLMLASVVIGVNVFQKIKGVANVGQPVVGE